MSSSKVASRPWPRPGRSWIMSMVWEDLAFLHWPMPVEALRPLLPPGLRLDLFEGRAWVGVVPFRMSGVRPRFAPVVPGLSRFPELNVRTYVTVGDRPGVAFFSLDAQQRLAVRAARATFHLPYFDARIDCLRSGEEVVYRSRRTHQGQPPATFESRYRPTGEVYRARPGDLDHWLTERYCLYSADRKGRIYRGEVDHAPWPLQPGEATDPGGGELEVGSLLEADGLPEVVGPPLVHLARRLEVVAWSLERV